MAGLLSTRPSAPWLHCRVVAAAAAVLGLLACGALLAPDSAPAQELQFPKRPPPAKKSKVALEREKSGQKQMLVQATEINYDYANNRVAAVGNVQIYYGDSTLEADRVVYDQKTKRLHAEGNVRLTEQDGKVTYGEVIDLSDDYRDGFVDSLRLDAPDQTRMAATRAERSSGNYTVFHNGVYTACAPCKDDPKKPPLWQVKAARIIHDQGEKMIYFEDARIEFFGQPLLYMPYFSAPDPTVKRKTGFLMPSISTSTVYGGAIEVQTRSEGRLVTLTVRDHGSDSPLELGRERHVRLAFVPAAQQENGRTPHTLQRHERGRDVRRLGVVDPCHAVEGTERLDTVLERSEAPEPVAERVERVVGSVFTVRHHDGERRGQRVGDVVIAEQRELLAPNERMTQDDEHVARPVEIRLGPPFH